MSRRTPIVAAVDLNRKAKAVVSQAARLATVSQLDLVIAHAIDPHPIFESDHIPVSTGSELAASERRYAHAWLLDLAHQLGLATFEIAVLTGNPADAVAELALERDARFVITGTPFWGPLSPMARLAEDPRIRTRDCQVFTAGSVLGAARDLNRRGTRWLALKVHPLRPRAGGLGSDPSRLEA